MGVKFSKLVDSSNIPKKVSELENDKNFVTSEEMADNMNDFYPKEDIDNKFANSSSGANGLYYENNKLYLTRNGEIVSEPIEITGGSGSGSTSNAVLTLTNLVGTNNIKGSYGSAVNLKFNFTSLEDGQSTGKAICNVIVNGVSRKNITINQGENEIDISDVLNAGENAVKIKCTDIYGNYRILAFTITLINLTISTTFDDSVAYSGSITYKYIPYGSITKVIHFVVDGKAVATKIVTSNGKQYSQVLPAMSHGSHRIEVYATAELEGEEITSDKIVHDVICLEEGKSDVIVASNYNIKSLKQGELVSIPYVVYNPSAYTSTVQLDVIDSSDNSVISSQTLTVDRTRQYWNTRECPVGTMNLVIKVLDSEEVIASKTIEIEILENSLDIQAVTNDLELHLTSTGRSNSESNPAQWNYGDYSTTFENINWKSTGWVNDDNGDTCLRLRGDARATVHFKPFNSDLRVYGKTIELEFAVRDVNNRDGVLISCESNGIGLKVTADTARLSSEQSSVSCNFSDEEKIRVAFTIESRNEYRLLSVYLNGVLSGAKQYPANDNFQQTTPLDISIGSSYCGIDLYNIRSYSTALTTIEVNENYIADSSDFVKKVEMYEENQVFDDYQNISYEKIKSKIPVVIVTGTLPTSKEDEVPRVTFKYENPLHPELDFEDTCKIEVQGTSSQYYVVKNWKISKFGNEENALYRHALNQLATGVFCLKADYAESTSSHNTQNANFVETLYDEPTPAQEDNELCRTTIFGFPCVMFHKDTESDELEFVGKYNFNYDKGSENVFGFTTDYDVECWEFCNNTSDACLFKDNIGINWSEDFEARYAVDPTDISRFREMHSWVVSTKNDVTKFKNEFEYYFDLHYCLIYYVYTFVMLMVDQRAKNMFLTYWDSTKKWQPWFYDNDTCLGINNEGQLVFDYYHEDIDKLNNANVYNGQESVLWTNFRLAYASEIEATYKALRSSGKLTYEKLHEAFIDNGSNKWSASIYNEDSEFKYISMLKSDNDASNLYQIRGTGEEHFRYFVSNRLKYCDSKWNALSYADNYVSLRIYTPSNYAGVTPNANITITPYSNMYAGVIYKANGTLQQKRVAKNEVTTFVAPNETFNDTETAIYGASELSSLGDLAPLYCGYINVSKATKLIELKVGDATEGYSNTNLMELYLGTNNLLQKIDVRNCPNLAQPLSLANCPNVREIYAQGSGITGVELPDSGYLKVVKLPNTIANLTMRNQLFIEDFSVEGYDSLKTLWIENCPALDPLEIIEAAPNLERIRLVGVNWSFENTDFLVNLSSIGGIDENGLNTDNAQIIGTCHITSLTGADMKDLKERYPFLTITYDNLSVELIYMNEDGTQELGRETILNGGNGKGLSTTPTKPDTAQYDYEFAGWSLTPNGSVNSNALVNVEMDRTVYAAFSQAIRYYSVRFYNDTTLLETQTIPYGGTATYSGSEPTKTGVDDPENYSFIGWNPVPTNITGNLDCYAQFKYAGLEVTTLSTTLPQNEASTLTSVMGNNIYVFGAKNVYKFNTTNETITTLNATFSGEYARRTAVSVGTNVYMVGGYLGGYKKDIHKFDCISETFTSLGVNLSSDAASPRGVLVGTDIYFIVKSAIDKFDTTTETITTLSATLPQQIDSPIVQLIDNDIYIIGGIDYSVTPNVLHSTIYKFNITSETITNITSDLNPKRLNGSDVLVDEIVYIFGGQSSTATYSTTDTICTINPKNYSGVITLNTKLPSTLRYAGVSLIGNTVYLFGGNYNNSSSNIIIKVSNL